MTSPPPPDRAQAVQTARTLAEALQGLGERLDAVRDDSEARDKALDKYGHQNRRRIWLSYALIAVDVALSVLVGLFAWQAHEASTATSQLRQASIVSCQNTNTARAESAQIWYHLFALSLASKPAPAVTPQRAAENRREIEGLRAYIARVYAARDCRAIYRAGG